MVMEKKMVAMVMFMVVSLFLGCCDVAGTVYKVGDEDGWTVKPNYTYWTSTKNFEVGDTICNLLLLLSTEIFLFSFFVSLIVC